MALLAAMAVLLVLLGALVALLAAVAVARALAVRLRHCVLELDVEHVGLGGAGGDLSVLTLCFLLARVPNPKESLL